MAKNKKKRIGLDQFILHRVIDTEMSKSGTIIAAREASKKLKDIPKILQSKKISRKLKKSKKASF